MRITEQREENQTIARNYFNFLREWLRKSEDREIESFLISYEMTRNQSIVKDPYLLICWDRDHYNSMRGYSKKNIYKKLTPDTRWQLKRGLGLALEHLLVYHFRELIPAYGNVQSGLYSYDFYVPSKKDSKFCYYDKVDLKICFDDDPMKDHTKPKKHRNKSIYNIEIDFDFLKTYGILMATAEGNSQKLREFCQEIYREIKLKLLERDREKEGFQLEPLHIKNSDNWELSEFSS